MIHPTQKTMKITHTLAALAATTLITNATVIFNSDFSGDAAANPAPDTLSDGWFFDNVLAGNANSVTDANEHRIFTAAGGGGFNSLGWISNVEDAYITVDLGIINSNTTYTIDFLAGTESSIGTSNITYQVDFLIGGTLASAVSAANDSGSDVGDGAGKNADEAHTFDFTTAATNGTDHAYLKLARTGGNAFIFFDDISVDATTIPEPSSTALLGLAGLALILRRRK